MDDERPMTYMEKYEAKQYMQYLDVNYQRALRKSGKGCAAKSLGPIFAISFCIAALIACPFVLYGIIKNCYYPNQETTGDNKSEDSNFGFETTTIEVTTPTVTKCSAGYGAGLIIAIIAAAIISAGLAILCHKLYKKYAAVEHLVHAGAAKIRVDGSQAPPGQVFVIGIDQSYHMHFLTDDTFVRKMEARQAECFKSMVTNCWFEEEANDENRAEFNDVLLSEYLYTVQNPLLWQKFQDFCITRGNHTDEGGYINLDCFGSDFDVKSLVTHKYIRDVEMTFPSNWSQPIPSFTGKEGLFFMVADVQDIIPIIRKGLKKSKGPIGKALYMYDNLKTAVEKPQHQRYCEPKCLIVVRARIENVCTLSESPKYKKSDFKKYSCAAVESLDKNVFGREFAFFDANMCVPLFVAVYRRKFTKELTRTREAVFKILNDENFSV